MISFRLSAEEYEKYREFCFTSGMRSVSEMARAAINMLLQQPDRAPREALETRVSDLEGRLHMLSLEVKHINQNAAAGRIPTPTAQIPSESPFAE